MKKATLLFLLLVLAVALSAQVGLFGLEYGAKTEDVKALLKSKGFSEVKQVGSDVFFSPATTSELPTITLTLTSDGANLYEWDVSYPTIGNPDIIDNVYKELVEIHGEEDVLYDYGMDYIWYFSGDHALYAIEAGGKFLLEYTYGNWDDDDYYWYEDY